jgi:hypothetical protein
MTNILNGSDLQLCSLANLEENGKKVAFILGNRPTSKKNLKQKEESLKEFEMNLTPLVYINGEEVISNGASQVHLANPITGEQIEDGEASNYVVIIDGQHRYEAALSVGLDHNNIILMKDYSGIGAQNLIARINNETCPWVASEWAFGAHMLNPDNEVAAFASRLAKEGYKSTTIGLILYFHKGVLGKKAFSSIMNGGDAVEGYDIERANDFLTVARGKFDDKFIMNRYLINVVSNLCTGRDYKSVLNAIDKLSEDDVKTIIESKSDDKENVIKDILLEYMSEE